MNILLVNPLDREFMPPSIFPLGLAYIAAVLKNSGHNITIVDLNGNRDNGFNELESTLRNNNFGLIGISSIITQYKKVKKLAKFIKSITPEIPLVMGGTGPTSIPELYIKNCFADVVCIGEGEETVKHLVECLGAKRQLDACEGIVFKKNNSDIVVTHRRASIPNINCIDMPEWSLFKFIDKYTNNFLFKFDKTKGINILATRGCPGRCTYCMCNFGRKIRTRSAENISEEVSRLVSLYDIKHIHFIDDTLITTSKSFFSICDVFRIKFPGLTWSANARVDLVKPENLNYMKTSGCIFLAYGIESGSVEILREMKKEFTPECAGNAIKWTRQAGIDLRAYFMIGMPGETPDTIKETVEFCKEYLVGGEFFFATPFPSTELYNYARNQKIINDEDRYLELTGEVRNFLVNLTQMTNEELFELKEKAEMEIQDEFRKRKILFKSSIRVDPRKTVARLPRF